MSDAVGEDGEAVAPGEHFNLRLYVAGQSPKSLAAIANLQAMCKEHLPGRCSIEIIDLREQPELAARDQVVAIPTLVRHLPPPLKRIIGSLADVDKVLVGLEITGGPR